MVRLGLSVLVGEIVGEGRAVFIRKGIVAKNVGELVVDGAGGEFVREGWEVPIMVQLTTRRISTPRP